jgi:hypothetical protein
LRAGSEHVVSWAPVSAESGGIEEMELILSLDGGATYPLRVTRKLSKTAREFTWRIPNIPTGHAHLALRTGSLARGEAVVLVSAEFSIEAEPTARLEDLGPFRGEFRVGDAAVGAPPVALPDPDLGASPDAMSNSDSELLADESPVPILAVPVPASEIDGARSTLAPSLPSASIAPLRLSPSKRE